MTNSLRTNLRRLFLLVGAMVASTMMTPDAAQARQGECAEIVPGNSGDEGPEMCLACDCEVAGWFWVCLVSQEEGEVGCLD